MVLRKDIRAPSEDLPRRTGQRRRAADDTAVLLRLVVDNAKKGVH
jgi:hypothetical protein